MDKEQLARKLYIERVSALLGDRSVDEEMINQLWENKASPADAAKTLIAAEEAFQGPAWLGRYLERNK